MGEMDVMPEHVSAGTPGTEFPAAVREAVTVLFGIPGAGPTGTRASSR